MPEFKICRQEEAGVVAEAPFPAKTSFNQLKHLFIHNFHVN